MSKHLVIAEKPSVARDIARVLHCNKKTNNYIEGNDYVVTWALGHLVTLADPEEYGKEYQTWSINIVVTASFALIISVYMSVGSESLCHHARTLVCAYLKPSHSAWLLKFCRLFRQSFANFLTGQCSEAVILGILMALAFSVFKIPYGSLVGMLTAICAIIPYVGALISCVVSVFLVLLVDPVLAVRCLIVYLAVQFIENQFIYPRVVGKSVGLSPLYTLVAAMIGGELFGIIGIIFFIPLTAVIIELVKEDACRRIQAREPQRSGPSE